MNTQRRALGDNAVDPHKLDAYFTLEDVSARVEAALALQRYGTLLVNLAGGADEPSVRSAGERLISSLSRLKAAGRLNIADDKLSAIGSAVASVGGLAVETQRARALREITTAAGPAVRRLAELLRQDFDPSGDHWSLGYHAAAVKLEERISNVRADLAAAPPSGQAERAALDASLAQAEALHAQDTARFAEVGGRIVAAVDAMVLAEQDLRTRLVAPDVGLNDLDPFSDRVAELVQTYRILSR